MRKRFVCQGCGASSGRWAGKCDHCGEWDTIVEEKAATPLQAGSSGKRSAAGTVCNPVCFTSLAGEVDIPERRISGIGEFDRVMGGGLTQGSAVLVGGDPGIGKSTLLLQAAAAFAGFGMKVAYISGEEAVSQIRARAFRLGLNDSPVFLASETSLNRIIATLKAERFDILIIDSVQTMWLEEIDSAPGSVMQVRSCTHELVTFIKRENIATVIVGHVTKEGNLAGPRTIEHMVDTVLYFEGGGREHFRILRTVKNRFGPANEIGVFEMKGGGLEGVENPSGLFLKERNNSVPGSVIFAGIEGTRPLLVEIQALVTPASPGAARRITVGLDAGRLSMIIAVLQARCRISLKSRDVYLNVTGGLKITEPAADLAILGALVSACRNRAWPGMTVFFGELCLSGFIRSCVQSDLRLKEAANMGCTHALVPARVAQTPESGDMRVSGLPDIRSFIDHFEQCISA